jgi:hypothetical protein
MLIPAVWTLRGAMRVRNHITVIEHKAHQPQAIQERFLATETAQILEAGKKHNLFTSVQDPVTLTD